MSELDEPSAPAAILNTAATSTTKKKVTLYFSAAMLSETQHEAIRQDRSISWIIQAAWRRARDELRRLPGSAASGREEPPQPIR